VTVNGTAYTLTITPGNYTSGSSLVAAVNSAISAAGLSGSLQAGLSSSGQMVLATVDQGSSQSLQVTGGGALSALGLSVMSSAASGANAVVNVDGTSNTLTTVAPGSTYTLSSGSGGSISATVEGSTSQPYVNSSLVSVGSISAQNVSTGNGSLADVVQAINSAGVGFSASAVQTSAGYQLELTASATGSASDITIAPGSFASTPLGTLDTAIAGSDAQVSIGGASGPVVSSPTNSLTGLLAGVTIDLHSVSSSPVTVTVSSDAQAMATKVQAFVNAANQVLSDINSDIGYNAATKTGGPLMGSAALQNLQQQILSLVATAGEGTSLGSLAAAGVTLTSNGTMTQLAFNKSTFDSAYAANPSAVQALFAQGGTFAPSSSAYTGQVSLLYAGSTTQPGTYSVHITQSATQATDTGTALSAGSVSAAETLSVATGGQSIAYSTYAGESLQSIASGLNQAFSGMGMALNAQVNSSDQLQILSDAYGSSATFTVSSTNTASGTTGLAGSGTASFTGTNVAGTIDGMAATGNGQSLTASSASPLGGMVLEVTTPGITSSTNIGSFTYTAGAGQDYVQLANQTSNPTTGQLGYVISGLQQESTALNPEIANYQQIANQEQQMLQNEFSQALSVVSSLHSQGSYLSQFISATGL
jgi:flagellar hook-associated protein 2